MRSDAESIIVRLAGRLRLGFSAVPLRTPEALDPCHWYSIWQGDAFPD